MNYEEINCFDELSEIRKCARNKYIPVIQDEALLVLINDIKEVNPRRILEIGTAIGYSSILLASNSQAIIDTIEKNSDIAQIAKDNIENFQLSNRINVFIGDALDVIKELLDKNEYDYIFIDGPKSHYLEYVKIIVDKNIKNKMTIVSDDVLFLDLVKGDESIPKKHRTIVRNLREYISYMNNSKLGFVSKIYEVGHGIMVTRYLWNK